MFITT